ncbi:MAG TPA: DUF3592 domain-containing protein [Anaeromyxobacteraceae bacterium]|nr:DUF3592 domain-containing protein [Anaeromyxobacteraceae bacterium]
MKPHSWIRDHRSPVAAGASLLVLALLFAASDLPYQVAVALATAGALALSFRSVLRVDARRERARIWWTLLGALLVPVRSIPLVDVRAVRLDHVARGKRTRFEVGLRAEDATAVWSGPDLLRARRFAERVASGLGLPLQDGSTGRFRTRDPDELEMTLGERLRRDGPEPVLPVPPPGSPFQLLEGPESAIRFPGQPLSPAFVVFWLGVPALFIVFFWLLSTPGTAALFLPIPIAIGLAFTWGLLGALGKKTVVVGPAGVEVRMFGSRRRIAFADLEEVVHARDGLHLLSDEAYLVVSHGWMESVLGDSRFDTRAAVKFVADVIERAAWHHAAGAASPSAAAESQGQQAPARWEPPGSGPSPSRAPPGNPPRRRRRPADRMLLQVGALFLLVGLAGVGGAGWWAFTVHDFTSRAAVTSGTVVEVRRSGRSRRSAYRPVVRFHLPSGQPVVFRESTGSNPPSYRVGEQVEVRYDPARPSDARAGSLRNLWAWPFFVGGMAVVFAAAGLVALAGYRQERREARGLVRGDVRPASDPERRDDRPRTR